MKSFAGLLLLIVSSHICNAQFYYKDQVEPQRTAAQWKLYKENKVRSVKLSSFEGDGTPSEGFLVDQEMAADFSRISTHTHSAGTPESWLIASYSPAGLPVRTLDSSDSYKSISQYQYDQNGQLLSITNTSLETDNQLKETEQHIWQYRDKPGPHDRKIPNAMLKIRNGNDTTWVRFVTDEKGNVTEERAVRNKTALPVVYYYYDSSDRLTDIVRYNIKAQRLLPDFIFEYDTGILPVSMLIVPEGSNNYQRWVYHYDQRGLKTGEACYNKQKQLMGRVEYTYN